MSSEGEKSKVESPTAGWEPGVPGIRRQGRAWSGTSQQGGKGQDAGSGRISDRTRPHGSSRPAAATILPSSEQQECCLDANPWAPGLVFTWLRVSGLYAVNPHTVNATPKLNESRTMDHLYKTWTVIIGAVQPPRGDHME